MKLFEETKIGNMVLKNHFVRSATWENMATKTGHMTKKLFGVYEALVQGEVGLIITGYANIIKEEQPNPGMMGIYNDSFIKEYKELTSMAHENGSKIILQLAYGGTKTTYNLGERTIYAPSEVREIGTQTLGKAMSESEIGYVVNGFVQASRRAKAAGFDGIEIHGAHSYLINQFLSPYYNRRDDQYGGSLENRMRFLVEIYEEVRETVGNDFSILVKLTASDFFESGLTFDETRIVCKKLEALGVDAIEISGNIHGKAKGMVGQFFDGYEIKEEGYFLEYGKVISDDVKVPIITVGGLRDIKNIEAMANTSNIELFALARPLLTEPNLIKRWKEGDRAPAKCIRCSKCRTDKGNYCTVIESLS